MMIAIVLSLNMRRLLRQNVLVRSASGLLCIRFALRPSCCLPPPLPFSLSPYLPTTHHHPPPTCLDRFGASRGAACPLLRALSSPGVCHCPTLLNAARGVCECAGGCWALRRPAAWICCLPTRLVRFWCLLSSGRDSRAHADLLLCAVPSGTITEGVFQPQLFLSGSGGAHRTIAHVRSSE